MSPHVITVNKVKQFLRRNGYDCMTQFHTPEVCHIVVTQEITISVVDMTAEILFVSRFDGSVRVSETFYTMEQLTDYFLNLGVVQ